MNNTQAPLQPCRLAVSNIESDTYWADSYVKRILEVYPDLEEYTVSAGISPSGVVHFGNFRDVATSYAIQRALEKQGKKVRFLFFWDEYDRLRKIPKDIPESFTQYLGCPLTSVPDPNGEFTSYTERFQTSFVESMVEIGINLEYRHQTKEYTSGVYTDWIILAMQKRYEIADVLLSFMSDKAKTIKEINKDEYREAYYPIAVYSRFSGKDTTTITKYDGNSLLTYHCNETGQEETIDLTKDFCTKLNWKVDWAMRWVKEKVIFEPGGKDHASPNGSYDVSSKIARTIFGGEPPFFAGYEFVGLQGIPGKMSSSKGGAISPGQLLEIYEPALVKWLYFRKTPQQVFNLAFDSEVIRQYDEFDREVESNKQNTLTESRSSALHFANPDFLEEAPISFRQSVALGQILQWDTEKVRTLSVDLGTPFSKKSIESRLPRAKNWLEKYNEDELIIVRDETNTDYINTLSTEEINNIRRFRQVLLDEKFSDIKSLEVLMYDIPKDPNLSQKENSPKQRSFFTNIYQLLITKDTGPRLSTFLWALDRKKVLKLLDV